MPASAAAPITAFLIAPIAEFVIIPYMNSGGGVATWSWLLGEGEARGIAFVFLIAGLAFLTRSYRKLSQTFAGQTESVRPEEVPGPGAEEETAITR